jgi:5-methylcytosine-specific restriction endonuclease McrA
MNDMQVLLLNSSEEILNVIPWHRAVRLVHTGKASAPAGHDDYYRIATGEGYFDLPTAIVLVEYVNVPYSNARLNRKNILKRDEHKCQYCSASLNPKNQTLDHVLPISRGGKDSWTNLIACCKPCNAKKANKTPEEAGMKLLSKPSVPTRRVLAVKYINKHSGRKWERWIE